MDSTQRSTQADPRRDGDVAPLDPFIDIEQAMAKLVYASYPPDARGCGPAPDRSADARISQSFAAGTLGAADLRPPIPRKPRSRGKRGSVARVAIVLCLAASAIWAWRSYGDSGAPAANGMSAPPPARAASQAVWIGQPTTTAANDWGPASAERKQVETSALAALRQTVEQLAAGQEQLTREIARLQAEKAHAKKLRAEKPEKRMLRRVPAHPARALAARARKPAPIMPMPTRAARRVATVNALSPPRRAPPQIPSQTQPPNPLRPPMPIP